LWRAWTCVMGMAKQKPPKQRKFGKGVAKCRRCGTTVGVIRKYKLYICRRCINEVAPLMGFKVYS
jgi:small subunit ribosomal protein S14